MGFEVEIKFRAADHADLARRLLARGATAGEPVEQVDLYLAHPARDFAATNEALRIRREGDRNRLTYKGPKHAGPTKTREEVEVAFAGDDAGRRDLGRIFEALGFRPVAEVRKIRTPYHLTVDGRAVEVGLDVVAGLGTFAEVEALGDGPDDLPELQALVQDVARDLGLVDREPRSYLRMTLAAGALVAPGPLSESRLAGTPAVW